MATVDDDIRLRYLQAQRHIRSVVHLEVDETFRAEDVERNLNLFARLHDDEAFDDWLAMGVTTTVESTLNDGKSPVDEPTPPQALAPADEASGDLWSQFRTLLTRKVLSKPDSTTAKDTIPDPTTPTVLVSSDDTVREFDVALRVAEKTIEAVRCRLDDLARQWSFRSLDDFNGQMLYLIGAVEGESHISQPTSWDSLEPQRFIVSGDLQDKMILLTDLAAEMSEHLVSGWIDLDAVTLRLSEVTAVDAAGALQREITCASAIDLAQTFHDVSDSSLKLKFLSRQSRHFESRAPVSFSSTRVAVDSLHAELDAIASNPFPVRKDVLDTKLPVVTQLLQSAVMCVTELQASPFQHPLHVAWQSSVASLAVESMQQACMKFLSLSISEIQISCSGLRAASKVKAWVVFEGVSLPEVSFRILRQESLPLGFALCATARHVLHESGPEFDSSWGFVYW